MFDKLIYMLPLGSIGLSLAYAFMTLREKIKDKNLNKKRQIANNNQVIVPQINSTYEEDRKNNLNKALIKTEVYSINYGEANSETNSEIEIERNMRPYFDALIEHIRSTKGFICVLDYPEHGKEMEQDGVFYEALQQNYDRYFSSIEEIVKNNKNIQYTRILQLPLGSSDDSMTDEEKVKCAINKLYTSTQVHINKMLDLDNFKLFIVSKACTNYSEVIIDNHKLFIELDRYDINGRAKPNRLIINTVDPSNNFSNTIRDEHSFINYVLTNKEPITRHQIDIAVREISNEREALIARKANIEKAFEKNSPS